MKRSFFLNIVLTICTFFCIVSCTYDTDIPERVVTKNVNTKLISVDNTMELLVEYRKGTSASTKKRIRSNYIITGLLLGWEQCKIKDNENVEVWIVNPEIYYAKDPAPITDSDKEDMERLMENANCKDYKKN
ncbi:hypothetical protein IWQ47_000931 [Aquimarina sp. EL_43]|uniref:hypothetical protein n=1 Tax=unclassified Aquimarina TaxID=2627091 RepID=UPI0018C9D13C|nr:MULTISPECIES: hypothetical protein [unclassified Aquimarina]MBG6129767.1 hypothetical protein [Aquimarina sp. EL_35]MBG6150832.1 hypothetical protein [Aquimarina sp. EL_32]MBG6167861.1 hypothetical protein [Aquimarina sp. EL_43]